MLSLVQSTPMPQATSVADATRAELEAADAVHTVNGQLAILLARRIDNPDADSGNGVAALVKALTSVMNAIRTQTRTAPNLIDELRAKRERRQVQP